ncbi:MAG: hypothetical protein OXU66_12850 [Gammaproteobacteria bacterium]|nr:hypothetical protein [Gammaproteobacteria bacterium]MDD9895940.1 hypothetical protein [Gammaproteobacteria bacterium]MDD9959809.1 hypothetical protein [Gammaproteobacteria bacterium]
MRILNSVLLATVISSGVAVVAQDVFEGITNEPRPEEYIHWNSDSYAAIKSDLQQSLREGNGIFGTDFVYLNGLPAAQHRTHNVQFIHRSGYTQPEIHENKWDIYVIVDGRGTARIGGERVNFIEGRSNEGQYPELEGAQEYQVTAGDILHVPARVWHQMITDPDETITYALINIIH